MLECQNCGAVGDSFFSENYFGEMVCELCGTQSFLQARNETQDVEDMGLDFTTVVKTLKRRVVRKKKRDADGNVIEEPHCKRSKQEKVRQNPKLPPLLDCVVATQMVLDAMARALVQRVGTHVFPADEYPKVVKELWFKFLHTWGVKGSRPLLRCYNEFFLHMTKEEAEKVDPALTFDLLEQWDAEWEKKHEEEEEKEEKEEEEETKKLEEEEEEEEEEEGKVRGKKKRNKRKRKKKTDKRKKEEKKSDVDGDGENKPKKAKTDFTSQRSKREDLLSKFSIVDLLGILMLASRVLNLGVLPSDFADWVKTGVIPYHNSLATCCADAPEVRDSVKFVSHFFQSLMVRHKAEAPQIAYSAQHLQYHMGLRLPPLNVSLAAHRICAAMGFPGQVFRNFQWITGLMNVTGDQPEPPLLLQFEPMGKPRFSRPTEQDKVRADGIIHSEVGIAAHLAVAIKMCANWHEWIYERQHNEEEEEEKGDDDDEEMKRKTPPVECFNEARPLPRRDLEAFTQFARQVFENPDRPGIPEELVEHVSRLRQIEKTDEVSTSGQGKLKQNALYAYPAIHVDGVLAESDEDIERRVKFLRSREINPDSTRSADNGSDQDVFFYPFYLNSSRSAFHPAYEHVLELLCRKINTPISFVLILTEELDKRMRSLVHHFERTDVHLDFIGQGRKKWMDARKPPTPAPGPTVIHASLTTLKDESQREEDDEASQPASRDPPPLDTIHDSTKPATL
ncbi:hypothetical protein PF005_g3679 [Phytophthora fragariae]|uniref:GATA-type domain-containing protein n=1 Tax=Phytophthora fragariae TaxID=53985 RepID=A0A6A3Z5L5_9STRA|nr:hypothetical protein PF009_g11985 [Phytophthora fragariae]KAE9113031.1 hypothetical protein PF010_g10235 [Phytophthora fragariae]KAE9117225.1 hypothetical protein PF006_g18853 [Phytophthora fragariae]KAE9229961.1 hypothetical protein PF005_g3679 [Phytophthora fragariae]KAE9233042.1 hypothetical protein PF002_g12206 [Phytophthora fragariae]